MVLAAALAVYISSAMELQAFRARIDPTQSISALMVRPEILEMASGEFRNVLADYLLLKASAWLGGRYKMSDTDLQAVATLFGQSLVLDPYFFQTTYYIQAFLPWGGRMVREAVDLLKIPNEYRYWDWQPGYYLGFDYFYFLKDNVKASEYLMAASERPNAPPFLAVLGARLAQKGGQTKAAIVFLRTMYERTERKAVKNYIGKRMKALEGVMVLEEAIKNYVSKYGKEPETLEQLVETGVIKKMPQNPYPQPYTYENGEIRF